MNNEHRPFVPKAPSRSLIFLSHEEMGLLDFIMKKLDGISRSKAKSILTKGGITVDGEVVTRYDFAIKPEMVVEVSKHPTPGAGKRMDSPYFKVVYEDRDVIVVEKAEGVLSMGVGHNSLNMKALLDHYLAATRQHCTAHVVHRLDCRTSGLMVYAKSVEVQQIMEHNWRSIVTDRRYVALVEGEMTRQQGHVESWLHDTPRMVVVSSRTNDGGKFASTDWRLLEAAGGYSLIELKLHTGRKNQIRVHMRDIHHPVVGDRKYGAETDPVHRLGLHAFKLAFKQPRTGEQLSFETPVPRAFADFINSCKE